MNCGQKSPSIQLAALHRGRAVEAARVGALAVAAGAITAIQLAADIAATLAVGAKHKFSLTNGRCRHRHHPRNPAA